MLSISLPDNASDYLGYDVDSPQKEIEYWRKKCGKDKLVQNINSAIQYLLANNWTLVQVDMCSRHQISEALFIKYIQENKYYMLKFTSNGQYNIEYEFHDSYFLHKTAKSLIQYTSIAEFLKDVI